ncbi:hypothetical protein TNCV_348711 [Trichonephila clavipes]|nr:hypothetical protein TNCV_348711 [Trichonephila clavipes]
MKPDLEPTYHNYHTNGMILRLDRCNVLLPPLHGDSSGAKGLESTTLHLRVGDHNPELSKLSIFATQYSIIVFIAPSGGSPSLGECGFHAPEVPQ